MLGQKRAREQEKGEQEQEAVGDVREKSKSQFEMGNPLRCILRDYGTSIHRK